MSPEPVPDSSDTASKDVVANTPGTAHVDIESPHEGHGFVVLFFVEALVTSSSCSSSSRIRDFSFSPISHGEKLHLDELQPQGVTYGAPVELYGSGSASSPSHLSYSCNLSPLLTSVSISSPSQYIEFCGC